jgi:hypothetical protein
MRLSIILTCLLCNLSSPFFAFAMAISAEPIPATDHLDEVNPLVKRTQIKVCGAGINGGGVSPITQSAIDEVSYHIANTIYSTSANKQCEKHSGSIDGLHWVYINGGSCHTTATHKTIDGAIQHFIRKFLGTELAHIECLRLTHGSGDWVGHLQLSGGDNDPDYHCGDIDNFPRCASGGEKYCEGIGC